MNLASIMRSEAQLLLPTYDRQKVLFEKGRGVYLWDSRGNRYLDFLSGIGVNALGHGYPAIQRVLKRQAGRLIHVSNLCPRESWRKLLANAAVSTDSVSFATAAQRRGKAR
jgi:acetylornithine aminotransferase/acetylornithine/N-succinyldiaminopimelate aminotransferase